jgi:hypothetical protein
MGFPRVSAPGIYAAESHSNLYLPTSNIQLSIMSSSLEQLKASGTTVVSDSGDFESGSPVVVVGTPTDVSQASASTSPRMRPPTPLVGVQIDWVHV